MQNITQAASSGLRAAAEHLGLAFPSPASDVAHAAGEAELAMASGSDMHLSALQLASMSPGKIGEAAMVVGGLLAFLAPLLGTANFQLRVQSGQQAPRDERAVEAVRNLKTEAGHPLPATLLGLLEGRADNHDGYAHDALGDAAAIGAARTWLKGTPVFFTGDFPAQEKLLLDLAQAATGRRIDSVTELNQLMAAAGAGPNGVPALVNPDRPDQALFTQLRGTTIHDRHAPGRMNSGGYLMRVGEQYCTIVPASKQGFGHHGLAIRLSNTNPVDDQMYLKPRYPILSGKHGEAAALTGRHLSVSLPRTRY
jgi:hypothetical protein